MAFFPLFGSLIFLRRGAFSSLPPLEGMPYRSIFLRVFLPLKVLVKGALFSGMRFFPCSLICRFSSGGSKFFSRWLNFFSVCFLCSGYHCSRLY